MQSPNSCARDGFMTRFLSGAGKNLLHPGANVNRGMPGDTADLELRPHVPTFSDPTRFFVLTLA